LDSTRRNKAIAPYAPCEGDIVEALHGAGKLLRVDYKTLSMTEFTPPSEDAGVYLAEPDLKKPLHLDDSSPRRQARAS